SPLDPAESGPVFHIVTPHTGNPAPEHAFALHKIFPGRYRKPRRAERAFGRVYKRMDTFNEDVLKFQKQLNEEYQKSKGYLRTQEQMQSLKRPLRWMLETYGMSDSLAIYFQRLAIRTFFALFLLSFTAVFFYQIYDDIVPGAPLRIHLYLGSLVLALIVY